MCIYWVHYIAFHIFVHVQIFPYDEVLKKWIDYLDNEKIIRYIQIEEYNTK